MASIKISELDNVTTLVDSDALPIVNGNKTKKVTISKLGDILATKDYVNEAIGDIGSTGFTPIIVETLPTSNISTSTVYLVLNEQQADKNIYNEYIYINNKWEIVGSTAVDLSNYYTKNEVDNMMSSGGGAATTVKEYQGATPIYKVGIEIKDAGSDSYFLSAEQTTLVQTVVQEAYDNGDLFFILSLCNTYADSPIRKIDAYLWRTETGTSFTLENGYNNLTYVKATEFRLPYVYNFSNKIANGVVTVSKVGISQMLWGDNIQPAIISSGHSGISQNVLGIANTTVYTPTKDYHPATKKYVDDLINVVNLDVSGFKANTFEISGSTTGYASSDANVKAALEKIAKLGGKNCLLYIHNGYGSSFCTFTGDFNSSTGGYGHYYVGFYTEDTSDRNSVKYTVTCNYSSDGSPANISIIYNTMQGFACTSNVLTKTNTASYTPSANYHPATKKYVDDAIAAALAQLTQ